MRGPYALRARRRVRRGRFRRGDFNVTAMSAAHGLVRVRGKLKFTFDIVAHQV
jgi:hypothetical protein